MSDNQPTETQIYEKFIRNALSGEDNDTVNLIERQGSAGAALRAQLRSAGGERLAQGVLNSALEVWDISKIEKSKRGKIALRVIELIAEFEPVRGKEVLEKLLASDTPWMGEGVAHEAHLKSTVPREFATAVLALYSRGRM
jgi:hypothetical protein